MKKSCRGEQRPIEDYLIKKEERLSGAMAGGREPLRGKPHLHKKRAKRAVYVAK